MNFTDLWVGDLVFIKSKGINGRWEKSINSHSALIRIGDKTEVFPLSDLKEPVQEETNRGDWEAAIEKKKIPKISGNIYSNKIDLHIESLNPSLLHSSPHLILNHQLSRCKYFIEEAISRRQITISIIHGHGTGVLKSEVAHLLKMQKELNYTIDKNEGGAIEAWFKYV